jgi:hypothetical protein
MFRTKCGCEWPDQCGGTGMLQCLGCSGDSCVCGCGGEMPCVGCDLCEPDDDLIYVDSEDD